jgi:proline racemase
LVNESPVSEAWRPTMTPSITGSSVTTGFSTIWIGRQDPVWEGFQVV